MKTKISDTLAMTAAGTPDETFVLENVELDPDNAFTLTFELPWPMWERVDRAAAFHLDPAQRGPCMLGPFPQGSRVFIEAEPRRALAAALNRTDDPVRYIRDAAPTTNVHRCDYWVARIVKRQSAPDMFVGFERTGPVPPLFTGDPRVHLTTLLDQGSTLVAALDEVWDELGGDAQDALSIHVVTMVHDGPAPAQTALVAWAAARPAERGFMLRAALRAWKQWPSDQHLVLVEAACQSPGGLWLDDPTLLDTRVAETKAWSAFVRHRLDNAVRELPMTLALALRESAVIAPDVYDAIASTVTGWSKESLVDVCRAMAHGGPVERAKWTLALVKRLKKDDPRWNQVSAAYESPLAVDEAQRGPDL